MNSQGSFRVFVKLAEDPADKGVSASFAVGHSHQPHHLHLLLYHLPIYWLKIHIHWGSDLQRLALWFKVGLRRLAQRLKLLPRNLARRSSGLGKGLKIAEVLAILAALTSTCQLTCSLA